MRLFTMNHIDSDLEEGEIPDDSPSSSQLICKQLPRRYAIQNSKSNHHKHKKSCKHSPYHVKKIDKIKRKGKGDPKSHQKPSVYRKSHGKSSSCKNHNKLSKNTFVAKQSSSFEDSVRLNSKSNWATDNFYSKVVETMNNDYSFSEMLLKYKAMRSKNSNSSMCFPNQISHVKKSEGLRNVENVILSKEELKVSSNTVAHETLNEASEDEQELRRIALEAFAKRKINPQNSVSDSDRNNEESLPKIDSISSPIEIVKNDNIEIDNYEVVDMDVEEDNQNLQENLDDDCFIIDHEPSASQNILVPESKEQEKKNGSDEEFEEDILRAELIEKMYRKKMDEDPVSVVKTPENVQKASPLKSNKEFFRENSVKVAEIPKLSVDKPVPEFEAKKSPKRLIISLNGESSSEESEQEDNPILTENPVASIEALISGIRQKSDSNDNNSVAKKSVPKHLECLSRAQQEEYNELMKILAKKDKALVSDAKTEVKNKVTHLPKDDLKVLEEKLMGVSTTLEKKKQLMAVLSKEVNTKKFLYMKSKLTAQHLKEKYIAAERQRRVNLNAWSKSCKNFESAKKTVSDLQNKIAELQELCSKVGSSIQGKNYSLPSVRTANGQH